MLPREWKLKPTALLVLFLLAVAIGSVTGVAAAEEPPAGTVEEPFSEEPPAEPEPQAPQLVFEPGSYDFGLQPIEQSPAQTTLQLRNAGSEPVHIHSLKIPSPGSQAFRISKSNCGSSLQPSESCYVPVYFVPPDTAEYAAQVQVKVGSYSFAADLSGSGGRVAFAPSSNPIDFGVVPQATLTPADMAMMRAGGIGSVRIPVAWPLVEPAPGHYEWGGLDEAVAAAAREGIEVLPYLYGTPAWLAPRPTELPVANAEQRAAWAALLQAAVARYGPNGAFWVRHRPGTWEPLPSFPIRAWQIWNEENFFYFATPASPRLYGRLLEDSATAIRSVDPGAKIILGGLYGSPGQGQPKGTPGPEFLERLYHIHGIKRFFDGVALHPYAVNTKKLAQVVSAVRRTMLANRDEGTGLYITELGWGSQNDPRQVAFEIGLKGQAEQLRSAYGYLISQRQGLDLKAIYWFAWRDAPPGVPTCDFCDSAGLFTADFAPKPAWGALVEVVHGGA